MKIAISSMLTLVRNLKYCMAKVSRVTNVLEDEVMDMYDDEDKPKEEKVIADKEFNFMFDNNNPKFSKEGKRKESIINVWV